MYLRKTGGSSINLQQDMDIIAVAGIMHQFTAAL